MQRKLAFGAPLFKFWLVLRCKCSDVLISLCKASFGLCGVLSCRTACAANWSSHPNNNAGVMKRRVHLCTHGVFTTCSFSSGRCRILTVCLDRNTLFAFILRNCRDGGGMFWFKRLSVGDASLVFSALRIALEGQELHIVCISNRLLAEQELAARDNNGGVTQRRSTRV